MIKVRSKYKHMMVNVDGDIIQFRNGEANVLPHQALKLSKNAEFYTIVDEDELYLSVDKNSTKEFDPNTIIFTISIVCYNNLQATKNCLASLLHMSKKFNYEVLITDNGSDQGTVDYLKGINNDRIKVFYNEHNEGFMNPHIEALNKAKGKFFVVLNNDFYIRDEFWLDKIFNTFVIDTEVKVVGPITGSLNPDGSGKVEPGNNYDYIEGSCLVIPVDFAKEINLFDNQLLSFAYCEDSDLSLRVRSMGYKIKKVKFPYTHDQGTTTRNPNVYPLVKLIAKKNNFKFRTRWRYYLETRKFSKVTNKVTFKMDKLYPFDKAKFMKAKKILLAREVGIGDVMFFTTCCSWLKSQSKDVEITFATNYTNRRVVQNNPYIDKVIPYDSIRNNEVLAEYDYGIHFVPFFGLPKYSKRELTTHRVDLIRDYFGASEKEWEYKLYYNVTDLETIWAENLLADRDIRKGIVSIVLTTTDQKRNYNRNTALVKKLVKEGYFVILIDKYRIMHEVHPYILNLTGQTTLGQTVSIIEKSDLIITPDTGILHLAGALNKNIITFFNSFPSIVRTKYYSNCYAFDIWKSCNIFAKKKPCLYSNNNKCYKRECFSSIPPDVLFNKAISLKYLRR